MNKSKSYLALSCLALVTVIGYNELSVNFEEILILEDRVANAVAVPCDKKQKDSSSLWLSEDKPDWWLAGGSSHAYACTRQSDCNKQYDNRTGYSIYQNSKGSSVIAQVYSYVDGELDTCVQQEFIKVDQT